DAIRRGKVSFEAFHSRLGALLAKVHQIKLSRFGSFNDSRGFANYLEFRFQKLEKNLKKFEPTSLLPRSLKSDIKTKVSFLIGKLSKSFEPVLIHGDPTPDNCVWTKDKEVVLVDWDNARAGFWLEDFSWLTYFGSHLTSKGSLSKRREVLFRSVLKNHGRCGLTSVEVIKIEKAFHILLAADLLGYYRFSQGNIKFYNKTKNRLFDLLK
ncbi:MAG: aminoglycoside phosphotransferase family protein, partial [bacterium]|nr:aminoglycoside phosphotransferase family protein [bacterium]